MNAPTEPASGASPSHEAERTHMAATRTLLSLVRTGAGISGGGALVTDLLVKSWPRWVPVAISSGFLVLGSVVIWAALRKGRVLRQRLAREHPHLGFLFPMREVTIATVALQLLIATVIVLYFFGH